jgi:hypothetical protein
VIIIGSYHVAWRRWQVAPMRQQAQTYFSAIYVIELIDPSILGG